MVSDVQWDEVYQTTRNIFFVVVGFKVEKLIEFTYLAVVIFIAAFATLLRYRQHIIELCCDDRRLLIDSKKGGSMVFMFKLFHRRGTDVSIMGTSGMTQKDPSLPQKRGKLTRGYVVRLPVS